MIQISISEFRKNMKHYSNIVKDEDILIINNGKPIMKIVDPYKDNISQIKSIKGILKSDKTYKELMESKLSDIWKLFNGFLYKIY